MSLIFATQLTAVATAVLAVFAIVTAVFAILAFRKQSQDGQVTGAWTGSRRAMLNQPADGSTVQLIRAGSRYGSLVRSGLEKNPDARPAARFTDDAGRHGQAGQDLHLLPLGNRAGW